VEEAQAATVPLRTLIDAIVRELRDVAAQAEPAPGAPPGLRVRSFSIRLAFAFGEVDPASGQAGVTITSSQLSALPAHVVSSLAIELVDEAEASVRGAPE